MESNTEHLKVAIRIRPLLDTESDQQIQINIIEVNSKQEITIQINYQGHLISSSYDKIFNTEATQDAIFNYLYPALEESIKGFNCTIFTYGQTGSGKTYTMFGKN